MGVITVIHTFGRDLKFNPYIHVLMTEGALD
ncbi:transposase [Bacillus sp. A301a_S52]|nr:transposase [Bacillus sp. A301a_S52]